MEHPQQPQPSPLLPPQSAAPPRHQPRRGRHYREILSTVGLFLLAPILALILTVFVFQFYRVEGLSMERTLQNNDRLVILKLPHTWARITGKAYIPARGDIVVFNRTSNIPTPDNNSEQLIKRVVALPGERVVIANGNVRVFNDQKPQGFNPDDDLAGKQNTTVSSGRLDITLDEDQVFVLGDNRANSLDSRVFGPLESENIVGKLTLRVYPFETY